jgi:hypothetical protein
MSQPNYISKREAFKALFHSFVTLCFFSASLSLMAAKFPVVNLAANSTSEAIQKSLDSMPQGGEVVLAAGKYMIHQPVILRYDHQTLRGSGSTTILYLADKANCPVVILGAPVQEPQRNTAHLRLTDLFIDGNRKHQQVEVWRTRSDGAEVNNNGVDVWAVDDVTVEHVTCAHCRSGGMVSSAVTRHLTVHDFTAFDNQFDGLACYLTEDSHFSKLFLHDNLAAGISLDLDFNHNEIDDAVISGNDLGVFMRQSRNNIFEGVTIQQSRHHGVFMAQSAAPTRRGWELCPGTQCTGNNFDKMLITNCGGKAFLVNNASCTNNSISASRFLDNATGGLQQASTNPVSVHELTERNSATYKAYAPTSSQSVTAPKTL